MSGFADDVGRRLTVLRVGSGRTQHDIARASGISVTAIDAYEHGRADVSLRESYRLSEVLCCTPDEICNFRAKNRDDSCA